MKRLSTKVRLALLLVAAIPLCASAQRRHGQDAPVRKETMKQRLMPRHGAHRGNPLMKRVKPVGRQMADPLSPVSGNVPRKVSGVKARTRGTLPAVAERRAPAAGESRFYGYLAYRDPMPQGIYQFGFSARPAWNLITSGVKSYSKGAAIINGKYYSVALDPDYPEYYGFYLCFTTDLSTGEFEQQDIYDNTLIASETAQAKDGTVYGQFLNEDESAFEWGIIDYVTLTRTTIGQSSYKTSLALGVTSDGRLFSVGDDGNLYRVDTATGAETLVGPTGLTLSDEEGYYAQAGEIDPKTDTFYWAATDINGHSGLYTVDLETGAATLLADYGELTIITGLVSPAGLADADAPDVVTDLAATFEGNSTAGSISFKAPVVTFGGGTLTGELTYTVTGGEAPATGTVQAGAELSVPVSAAQGMRTFTVTTANSAGESPKAKVSAWLGDDTPAAPTDITLGIDNATGQARLEWNAPATGTHGGYIGELTYNVYRIKGGTETQAATGQAATTFTETLPLEGLANYAYAVEAVYGELTGARGLSNNAMLGDAIEVPYVEQFATESSLDVFTIIDANNDGYTWDYFEGTPRYFYSNTNDGDDWLITPPVRLEAGKSYKVGVKARANSDSFKERIEVKMGTAPTAEAMTTAVVEPTDLIGREFVGLGNEMVRVESDGEYYFGMHAISEKNMFSLFVSEIAVVEGARATAPEPVSGLQAIADPTGALAVTFNFKAPLNNVGGEPLTGKITKITIARDGTDIYAYNDVEPGEPLLYADRDEQLTNGNHTYDITAYNGTDAGPKATVTVYVGVDVPEAVRNIRVADRNTSVLVAWDKPGETGANGGVVRVDDVEYNVYDVTLEDFYGEMIPYLGELLLTTKEPQAELAVKTDDGEQRDVVWAVKAANAAGESRETYAYHLVGKPYTLPLTESVAGGVIEYYWVADATDPAVQVGTLQQSSDGDGYSFGFRSAYTGTEGLLMSGKISLAGEPNPTLIFDAMTRDEGITLDVDVQKPDGTVESILADYAPGTGFAPVRLSLGGLASESYVRLIFTARFGAAGTLAIDNVRLLNAYEHNMLVSELSTPASLTAGGKAEVTVKVKNMGEKRAEAYGLRVTAGGTVLKEETVSEPLEPLAERTFTAQMQTTVFDEGTTTLRAEVTYDKDMNAADNAAEARVRIDAPEAAAPVDVKATPDGTSVSMAWTAPELREESKTESFENRSVYEPFSVGGITETQNTGRLGDWTVVNADGQYTYSLSDVQTYPNMYQPMAFQVFDASAIGEEEQMGANSGSQSLVSFCGAGDKSGDNIKATDHWLVSPRLSGKEQTLDFFYRAVVTNYGPEKFEVLASQTDDTAPEAFTKIADVLSTSAEWSPASFDLPEGTLRFAIRHTSDNVFGLMIDDISYTSGPGIISSYNIYTDRKLSATVDADKLEYTLERNDGQTHEYAVSAVYKNGVESKPAIASQIVTGIDEVTGDGEPFDIYSVDGRLVRKQTTSAEGLHGIYIVNGKAVVIKK